jgi:hypothetical protein
MTTSEPEPDVLAIFDDSADDGLVCRVCGALVPRLGDYPKVHWDWHEAANGA